MTVTEIRKKYLDFFHARGHVVIPSARLVPENDPTTLFTSSGMQPLIPYLLGQEHPQGVRVTDSQKSFRAGDIEEVGDNRHTTFFEMLGNWSFGDYFKKEQLQWFYEFLTKEVGLSPEKIWVSCFEGDPSFNLPKDTESAEIWRSLGIPDERIFFYGVKKNWWSRSGTPDTMPVGEPGGPDSEVFFDFGMEHDPAFGKECHPNCDCGRFMEIGNSVFMQYIKKGDGSFGLLPKANVDFGGGLERIAAASNNNPDVFLIDTLLNLIRELAAASGKNYNDAAYQSSFRIVADHLRAAVFMIGDGVKPANTEQGYVLRRLIRRAVRHMDKLNVQSGAVARMIDAVINSYKDQYPELSAQHGTIVAEILEEESRFRKTISQGMREFEKRTKPGETLSAPFVFDLYTTYGFPIELTLELARERGIAVDAGANVARLVKEHQELSRAGAAQKFAGGLADHQEQTIRYHTTHHILLRALQMVLGDEVKQRGSNITAERLRIDFSAPRKMTDEEKKRAEEIVNDVVYNDMPVIKTIMPRTEAEKLGAQMEFGVKYPDMVSVYSVGPRDAIEGDPKIPQAFSLEFCGGPHVSNTAEIHQGGKRFKIQKEEAVAQGIRRIKGVLQ